METIIENLPDLLAEHAELKARVTEIEDQLRALEAGTYEAGEHVLRVVPNRRFDKARFERNHPIEEAPELYYAPAPVLDASLIDPEVKEAYTREFGNKITIK